MITKPEEYKWSSYSMYIGRRREEIICSIIVLSYFKDMRRDLYKEYIENVNNNNIKGV